MGNNWVSVGTGELETILGKYLDAGSELNYAIKIVGHPGVGKSAIVRQIADKHNFYFIDTRLAFKENVDLSGYPVPDHDRKKMIYYRPKFIPPETVPEPFNGILWFLDEANRAHPTVIQTLFQIITDRICGEHLLPANTSIVLAGNTGDADNTVITDFEDSALDGRLAIFHLKPNAPDWLAWARRSEIHPAIISYVSLFEDKLWSEENIDPNPRGWHQVSNGLIHSYGLKTTEQLTACFEQGEGSDLKKLIISLIGEPIGNDFILQLTSPRQLTSQEVLNGDSEKLRQLQQGDIPAEDALWAISGTIAHIREISIRSRGTMTGEDKVELRHVLQYVGACRSDLRMSFFYRLVKECGLLSQIPAAIAEISDEKEQQELLDKFETLLEQ
jgi:hypothetical protein